MDNLINSILATICLHNYLLTRPLHGREEMNMSEDNDGLDEDTYSNEQARNEEFNNKDEEIPETVLRQREMLQDYFMSRAGAI